eukprot:11651224-Prorocentrum_lima.AAC.1
MELPASDHPLAAARSPWSGIFDPSLVDALVLLYHGPPQDVLQKIPRGGGCAACCSRPLPCG